MVGHEGKYVRAWETFHEETRFIRYSGWMEQNEEQQKLEDAIDELNNRKLTAKQVNALREVVLLVYKIAKQAGRRYEMKRTFQSKRWGSVSIETTKYHDGNLAIQLWTPKGEPLARLSVNLPKSANLPPNCFYLKDWGENEELALEAAASGWFRRRNDLPGQITGRVIAEVWELLAEKGEPFETMD